MALEKRGWSTVRIHCRGSLASKDTRSIHRNSDGGPTIESVCQSLTSAAPTSTRSDHAAVYGKDASLVRRERYGLLHVVFAQDWHSMALTQIQTQLPGVSTEQSTREAVPTTTTKLKQRSRSRGSVSWLKMSPTVEIKPGRVLAEEAYHFTIVVRFVIPLAISRHVRNIGSEQPPSCIYRQRATQNCSVH